MTSDMVTQTFISHCCDAVWCEVAMVIENQFPMFRLATLLARQLSAPIAARIKEWARTHPGAGRRACLGLAQLVHAADLRLRLWVLRARQPRAVPALSPDAALDQGANILGEAVVFTLGALIVTFEVNRQAMKQEDKVACERSAWVALAAQLEEVSREVELQQRELDRLHAALQEHARRPPPPPAPSPSPARPRAPRRPRAPHARHLFNP